MPHNVAIFDSTLRDGAQGEGISFSVEDKLKIVKILDQLGVSYIEAGNPGSNVKDLEFFKKMQSVELKSAKLTAFGSTRRKGIKVEDDDNVKALLTAKSPAVAIFGKTWDFHVTDIIRTTLEENLEMIKDTVRFFKEHGKEVIFDAEHFYDGYKANPEYALKALSAAADGGADCLALCDTNGGSFPDEIFQVTELVCNMFNISIGVHCHNDTGMAVANSIMAVKAGANHVQGTYIGIGERCGNANLSSIIPNLQLKKGYPCIKEENLKNLTSAALYMAEITNVHLENGMPFVGKSAFAHKGGMHIDGVKAPKSFEHITPTLVGNQRTFLMSEVSGRSTILEKIQKVDPSIQKDSPVTKEIMDKLKSLEHEGYQYEGAESSFELVIRKHLGHYKKPFVLESFKIISEHPVPDRTLGASSIIKILVDGVEEITATQGNGPVNALDKAMHKALEVFYPTLKDVHLVDYKVRVLDSDAATGAKVRVLIESTDGHKTWSTVGVSTDVIEASLLALIDSIDYKIILDEQKQVSSSVVQSSM